MPKQESNAAVMEPSADWNPTKYADDAFERQRRNKRARPLHRYRVQVPIPKRGKSPARVETVEVDARSENDAWAMACDQVGYYPSPRGRRVEDLGPAKDQE